MTTRAEIVAEARAWKGTRWQHQARRKGIACDCIGLVVGVGLACGIAEATAFQSDAEIAGYGPIPNPAMLLRACDRYLDPVSVREIQVADIAVMKFKAEPQHFGIVADDGQRLTLIHSLASARKVVEHGIDDLWRSRIIGVYSYRGIG